MTKRERAIALSKLTPTTWYAFCLIEANTPVGAVVSRPAMSGALGITPKTLSTYLAAWEKAGLVREDIGGYTLAHLDGQESPIKTQDPERVFKKAKDIVDYWCNAYLGKYQVPYIIPNWGMVLKNVKKLLQFNDQQISGTIDAIMWLYDSKWSSPDFPRPTLGQLCSWLFAKALPYADQPISTDEPEIDLAGLEAKGWI